MHLIWKRDMEVRVKCVRQRTSVEGKRFGKLALVRILGVMSNRAAPLASLSSHPASLPHPLEAWLAALVPPCGSTRIAPRRLFPVLLRPDPAARRRTRHSQQHPMPSRSP